MRPLPPVPDSLPPIRGRPRGPSSVANAAPDPLSEIHVPVHREPAGETLEASTRLLASARRAAINQYPNGPAGSSQEPARNCSPPRSASSLKTPMVTAGPRFGPVVPRPSGHAEQRWAVEHRTPTLDTVTHIGSMTADTIVALAATVGELLIFLVITATADRARPAVPQLDQPGAPHVELSVRPHRGGDRAVRVSRGDPAAQRHTSMGRCQPGHARIPHPHRCG